MLTARILASTLLCAAMVPGVASAQDDGLPDGPGKEAMVAACSNCHELSRVTNQRRSKAQWNETVDDMIARGAQVADPDYDAVIAYLATYFNPSIKTGAVKR